MKKWGFFLIGTAILLQCEFLSQFKMDQNVSNVILESEVPFSFSSVVKLHNDEMLLAYSQQDSSKGHIQFLTSHNSGKTWQESETQINTIWHCGSPRLLQISDNLILLSFTMYRGEAKESAGIFLVYSYDYGKTFTVPRKISSDILRPCDIVGEIIELDNGKLLIPISIHQDENLNELGILSSVDRGETWQYRPFFTHVNDLFTSPAWIQLKNGNILCQLESPDKEMLYQTYSNDEGESWSNPVPTQIYGTSAELFSCMTGALVSVYQDKTPTGIGLLYSYDLGLTWQDEVSISPQSDYLDLTSVRNKSNKFYFITYYKTDTQSILKSFEFTPVIPLKPKGLSGSIKENNIALRWNTIPEAHYYQIYKSINDSLLTPDPELIIGSTSTNKYIDSDVREGENYFYGIRAIYGKGPFIEIAGSQSELSKVIHIQQETEAKNDF